MSDIRDPYRVVMARTGQTFHQVRKAAHADGSAHQRVRRTDGRECRGSWRDRPMLIEQVKALRAAGWTVRAVAAHLDLSTSTVLRYSEPDAGSAFYRRRHEARTNAGRPSR